MIGASVYSGITLNLNTHSSRKVLKPDAGIMPLARSDPLVERAYQDFLRLPVYEDADYGEKFRIIPQCPVMKYDYILNPLQIDILVSKMIATEKHNTAYSYDNVFLSGIIQKSYTHGRHNNFVLTTGDDPFTYLGYGLVGEPDNKMKISIEGQLGLGCMHNTENIELEVKGEAAMSFATNMKHSIIRLYADSNNASCMANGMSNCILYVVDKGTYFVLCQSRSSHNVIALIDKSGKVLEMNGEAASRCLTN